MDNVIIKNQKHFTFFIFIAISRYNKERKLMWLKLSFVFWVFPWTEIFCSSCRCAMILYNIKNKCQINFNLNLQHWIRNLSFPIASVKSKLPFYHLIKNTLHWKQIPEIAKTSKTHVAFSIEKYLSTEASTFPFVFLSVNITFFRRKPLFFICMTSVKYFLCLFPPSWLRCVFGTLPYRSSPLLFFIQPLPISMRSFSNHPHEIKTSYIYFPTFPMSF